MSKSFPISWTKNLNADLTSEQQPTIIEPPSTIELSYVFCGKEGTIEQCKKCLQYESCFDQHCSIADDRYYIDYSISESIVGTELFVMIDDIFWHGLSHPIELIENPETDVDFLISQIYTRDKFFNEHCIKNKVPLIRFSSRAVSLFLMNRSDSIVPHFTSGSKVKVKKFISLLGTSIDSFIKNVFGDDENETKRM